MTAQQAVITGAADGIGRALALACAGAGYAVTGVDFDAERAAATGAELAAAGAQARFVLANLADGRALEAAAADLAGGPPIDLLVHCAGISHVGPFAGSDMARQQAVLDVNLRAPMLLTAGLLARGRIAPGATLVFIASLSVFSGYPGASVYAASKDGLHAYARSLRAALAGRQIGVLTVYPGPTRTAHARRYSPDNRREGRRMPPERLAGLILAAVRRRRSTLVAGPGSGAIAALGRLAPQLTEYLMRKTIYNLLR